MKEINIICVILNIWYNWYDFCPLQHISIYIISFTRTRQNGWN